MKFLTKTLLTKTHEASISMFKIIFEKHAPLEKKYLQKNLEAIMLRSKIRKSFLKDRTGEWRCKYKNKEMFG